MKIIPTCIASKMTIATVCSLMLMLEACKDDDPKVTKVDITSMSPESPATLKYHDTAANDEVSITYNYTVVEPKGARIWIKARSSVSFDGTTYYSPSPVLTGNGTRTVTISVAADDEPSIPIDKLKIEAYNAETGALIFETTVTVDYTFTE